MTSTKSHMRTNYSMDDKLGTGGGATSNKHKRDGSTSGLSLRRGDGISNEHV